MSIARHTAWTFVGLVGQQAARFFIVIGLARLLGPAEFGIVAAAQIVIAIANVLVNFGLGTALVQAADVDEDVERGAMTIVAGTSFVMATALTAGASPIADFMGIPEVAGILPLLAFGLFLQGLAGPVFQLMYREGRYREMAVNQFVTYAFGYGAVTIALAALGWSYWSIVMGALVQSVTQLVWAYWLRPVGFTLRPKWGKLKEVLHYGAGIFVANMLNQIARRGDNWVAGRMLGAAALGFYSRAYSLIDLVNEVPGVMFNRVLLPHFSRTAESEALEVAERKFYLAHVAAGAMSLPLTIATVLLAGEIVAILLGPGWHGTVPALSVLGWGMFFRLGYKVSGILNIAFGGVWHVILRQAIYAAIVVGGSIIAVPYGLTGISWAVSAALGWQFWALTNLALRAVGGTWKRWSLAMLPVGGAGLVAGLCGAAGSVAFGSAGVLVRLGVVGAAIVVPYLASLWLLRGTAQLSRLARLSAALLPLRYKATS